MGYDAKVKRIGKNLTEKQMELLALLYYGYELVTRGGVKDPYTIEMEMELVDYQVDQKDISALSTHRLLEDTRCGIKFRLAIKASSLGEQVFEKAPESMSRYVVEKSLRAQGFDLVFDVQKS